MQFDWLIFAFLAGVASNIFNYINRSTLKDDQDSTIYAWWFETIKCAFFLVVAFFNFSLIVSIKNISILLLLGTTEMIAVYFFMKMHAKAELSLSTIILNLRLVWTPLYAFLLLGEKLTTLESIGIVIIFSGLSFVTSPKKLRRENGVKIALISSIFTGLLSVFIKMSSTIASTPVVFLSMGLPATLFIPFMMKNFKYRVKKSTATVLRKNLLASVFNIVALYLVIWSLRLGSVGKGMAVFQATSLLSVLTGILFLRERKQVAQKLIGGSITLLGVWLLV